MRIAGKNHGKAARSLLLLGELCLLAGCASGPPPRAAAAWYEEGVTVARAGRTREALYCFKQATTENSRFAPAWRVKGLMYQQLDKPDKAIECFGRFLGLRPKDPAAWCEKGLLHQEVEEPDKAIACFDRALEIDPKHATALKRKGETLLNCLGKADDAVIYFKMARELDAGDEDAWNSLFNAYLILKDSKEAWLCYTQAREAGIRLEPRLLKSFRESAPEFDTEARGPGIGFQP